MQRQSIYNWSAFGVYIHRWSKGRLIKQLQNATLQYSKNRSTASASASHSPIRSYTTRNCAQGNWLTIILTSAYVPGIFPCSHAYQHYFIRALILHLYLSTRWREAPGSKVIFYLSCTNQHSFTSEEGAFNGILSHLGNNVDAYLTSWSKRNMWSASKVMTKAQPEMSLKSSHYLWSASYYVVIKEERQSNFRHS